MRRVVAFDTSLINLGFAVGVLHEDHLEVEYVTTFKIDKLIKEVSFTYDWDTNVNVKRTEMVEYVVCKILSKYLPDYFVFEQPLGQKNFTAVCSQVKGYSILQQMAQKSISSGSGCSAVEYLPNTIKQAVGIAKLDGDKDKITAALLDLSKQKKIRYATGVLGPTEVDDHANDSVAMLYCKYLDDMDSDVIQKR